jgi:hypothetical protein
MSAASAAASGARRSTPRPARSPASRPRPSCRSARRGRCSERSTSASDRVERLRRKSHRCNRAAAASSRGPFHEEQPRRLIPDILFIHRRNVLARRRWMWDLGSWPEAAFSGNGREARQPLPPLQAAVVFRDGGLRKRTGRVVEERSVRRKPIPLFFGRPARLEPSGEGLAKGNRRTPQGVRRNPASPGPGVLSFGTEHLETGQWGLVATPAPICLWAPCAPEPLSGSEPPSRLSRGPSRRLGR